MSIEATGWALQQTAPTATAKLVLIGLATHARADGGQAWPSVDTLATYADTTRRTVQRSLRALEDAGLIREAAEQPLHIPAHRRPVAYDLTMGRQNDAPDTGDLEGRHPGHDGATPVTARGDTGVARTVLEPSGEPSVEPSPSDDDPAEDDVGFEDAWSLFPKRNGKRVGKQAARAKWRKLALEDRRTCYVAIGHYRQACDGGQTIAKDMERFLKADYWRDWTTPAEPSTNGVHSSQRRATVSNPDGGWRDGEF